MKVVAINGSARAGGNTRILIDRVCAELGREGIDSELFELAGKTIHGCRACHKCSSRKDECCSMGDDDLNEILPHIYAADGLILGSPTYFGDISPEMKALIDRSGMVNRANGHLLKRKPGAAVVAVRRAGGIHAFDSINHYFTINQMIVVGSSYWNIGIGRDKGEVESDAEGLKTMADLGRNMAWLLKKLAD
jgi:multimeric flavodoxin WrbA